MIEIVKADSSMAERLHTVATECFADPWSAGSFVDSIERGSVVLCANEDGKCIGFATMDTVLDEAYISNVAVSPAFRGRGIGGKLLDSLLEEAVNMRRILLDVRVSNDVAIALYTSRGFKVIARRRAFYSLPAEDGLTMELKVEK